MTLRYLFIDYDLVSRKLAYKEILDNGRLSIEFLKYVDMGLYVNHRYLEIQKIYCIIYVFFKIQNINS